MEVFATPFARARGQGGQVMAGIIADRGGTRAWLSWTHADARMGPGVAARRVLTNVAERLAVPYPSLLAIAGAGLAFLPFALQIRMEPDLALALFVAPALLDATFDTSPRGLRDNAIPVASMAVVAVVLTTAAIAFLGWRFAGLPIAAAIALGAIVAPPDAVAANEVLRHLRIPQRIGLVLQRRPSSKNNLGPQRPQRRTAILKVVTPTLPTDVE